MHIMKSLFFKQRRNSNNFSIYVAMANIVLTKRVTIENKIDMKNAKLCFQKSKSKQRKPKRVESIKRFDEEGYVKKEDLNYG